jgi:hypothetical protein
MQSRLLFIDVWGLDTIVGSVWLVAIIFKCSPSKIPVNLNLDNLGEYLSFKFASVPASELNTKDYNISLVTAKAQTLIRSMQLSSATKLEICFCDLAKLGVLGQPAKLVPKQMLESQIAKRICKLMWQKEMQILQPYYPGINLQLLFATEHKQIGLKMLNQESCPEIRDTYLTKIPLVWLDLLRMGSERADLSYYTKPPSWWRAKFSVPFWHFLSAGQIKELHSLLYTQEQRFELGANLDLQIKMGAQAQAKVESLDLII